MTDFFLRVTHTFGVGGNIDFDSESIDIQQIRHWILSNLVDPTNDSICFSVSTLDICCATLSMLNDTIVLNSSSVYDIGDDIVMQFVALNNSTFLISFIFGGSVLIVEYKYYLTDMIRVLGVFLNDLKISAREVGMDLDKVMAIYADVHKGFRM